MRLPARILDGDVWHYYLLWVPNYREHHALPEKDPALNSAVGDVPVAANAKAVHDRVPKEWIAQLIPAFGCSRVVIFHREWHILCFIAARPCTHTFTHHYGRDVTSHFPMMAFIYVGRI